MKDAIAAGKTSNMLCVPLSAFLLAILTSPAMAAGQFPGKEQADLGPRVAEVGTTSETATTDPLPSLEEAIAARRSARNARDADTPRELPCLATDGGEFRVLNASVGSAKIQLRSTNPATGRPCRQSFEVATASDRDPQWDIARRVVEVIASQHVGEFSWRSQRLERIVILSTKPEDRKATEDFMRQDFFGSSTTGAETLRPNQQ